jgi:molybdenum cofactor cytidylyltransferase
VAPPRAVGGGVERRLLAVVRVDLEGGPVVTVPWQPKMHAAQPRAGDAGSGLQDGTAVVPLGWDGDASEEVDVEARQPAPIAGHEVGVAVPRLHRGHVAQSNSRVQGDRSVAAVVLAAGASRRYGSPKQLVVVDGRTLLEHVIGTATAAGLERVIVVVPVWLSPPPGLDLAHVRWIRNAFPERGVSLSLRLGLAALDSAVSAALILLGDQPGIAPATIGAVLNARGDRPLVAASADGVLAPPVLIERTHFDLVDELTGDVGLRDLMREHQDLVTSVPVDAHAVDLDSPADLGRIGGP